MAELERLDRVRMMVGEEIVELPWSSRFELLERLRGLHRGAEAVRRFEAVGAIRPVELDAASTLLLVDVLARWVDEVGPDGLPNGVFDLYDAFLTRGVSRAAGGLPALATCHG